MKLRFAGSSHIGTKSQENEDCFVLPEYNETFELEPDSKAKGHLFILCDGMGGANAGEIASKLCSTWFFKEYYEDSVPTDELKTWFEDEIDSLNNRLYNLSLEYSEYTGMGTTLVNILIRDNVAYYNNVGDSRLYLVRDGKLLQLTEDDSEVWKQFRSGFISKDEILTSARKNIVTQAMAVGSFVEVHSYDTLQIQVGDYFLLCSDGLSDYVYDHEIEEIFNEIKDVDEIANALIEQALENDTNDDTTVIVIKVQE